MKIKKIFKNIYKPWNICNLLLNYFCYSFHSLSFRSNFSFINNSGGFDVSERQNVNACFLYVIFRQCFRLFHWQWTSVGLQSFRLETSINNGQHGGTAAGRGRLVSRARQPSVQHEWQHSVQLLVCVFYSICNIKSIFRTTTEKL